MAVLLLVDGCCGVQRVEAQPTETQWINVRAKPMWSRLADSQTHRQVEKSVPQERGSKKRWI